MDSGVFAALIAAIVALLGIGVAAGFAAYQINKQARTGLKVELYCEIISAVEKQSDAERDAASL